VTVGAGEVERGKLGMGEHRELVHAMQNGPQLVAARK
jgi:hypothetical protein